MTDKANLRSAFEQLSNPNVLAMLFLGFSAGLPILLIFSSLSLWLREAGVERSAVTYFSWAALGYSFKFIWAPLVDRLPLPGLTRRLGRRRGWLMASQLSVMLAICLMAMVDPARMDLRWMAVAAILLGFSSATQDIVIDAFRIEAADPRLQAIMSSMYIAGYRLGMLAAGAGALVLAEQLGSSAQDYLYPAWRWSYLCMAALMVIGLVTTCLVREPERASAPQTLSVHTYLGFIGLFVLAVLGFVAAYVYSSASIAGIRETLAAMLDNRALAGVLSEGIRLCLGLAAFAGVAFGLIRLGWVEAALVRQTYVAPVADFFRRYGLKSAAILLALIGLYRVSDIVLGVISNVFYQDLGFSKTQIATIVKSYGLGATIAGGFLGGVLAIRFGVMRILLLGAVLSAATNVLFMWLAQTGGHELGLYLVITADNLSAGLASTAFVAFLSGLTNISFTAMQYALFSSLMTLIPKGLGGYSGSMVDGLGYSEFFMVTALMGVPVIVLIVYIQRTRILSMDPLPEQR